MIAVRFALRHSLFVAAALFVGAGCGATKPQVEMSAANGAGVARNHSYTIEISTTPPKGYSPALRSKDVLEMARPKVEAALGSKGYVLVANGAEADMIVRLSAGVKQVVDEPSGSANAAGAPSEIDEVSTLALTIVDRKTQETVLAGAATKEIHSKTIKDADVASAVSEILQTVPASAK